MKPICVQPSNGGDLLQGYWNPRELIINTSNKFYVFSWSFSIYFPTFSEFAGRLPERSPFVCCFCVLGTMWRKGGQSNCMSGSALQHWEFWKWTCVYISFIAFWGFVGQSIFSVYLFPTYNARHVISGASASPWQAQSGKAHPSVLHRLSFHSKPRQMFLIQKHHFQPFPLPNNCQWSMSK